MYTENIYPTQKCQQKNLYLGINLEFNFFESKKKNYGVPEN